MHMTLEFIQEKIHPRMITVNRAYYDENAATVNFSIDNKKHTLEIELDNSTADGYNYYIDKELIQHQPLS